MTEERKKKDIAILENTIKMYESTIEELKEKGEDATITKMALNDIKEQLAELNAAIVDGKDEGFVILPQGKEIKVGGECEASKYTPATRNMFTVEIGDVPYGVVRGFWAEEYKNRNTLSITFMDTKEFDVERYFRENKNKLKGQYVVVKQLGSDYEPFRTEKFKIKKVLDWNTDGFDYENSEIRHIWVNIRYSVHTAE